jgi:hypothetical protein
LVPAPWEPPNEVWLIDFENPAWTREWLAKQADPFTWLGRGKFSRVLDFHQNDFSWGASGTSYELLIKIQETVFEGIAGSLAYDSLKALVRTLHKKLDDAGKYYQSEPLGRKEAIQRSLWKIHATYGIPEDQLTLLSDEHLIDEEKWTIVMRDPDHVRYDVTLGIIDGLPCTCRIKREFPVEPPSSLDSKPGELGTSN